MNIQEIPQYIDDLSNWEKQEIEKYFLPESGLMIIPGPDIEISHLLLDGE